MKYLKRFLRQNRDYFANNQADIQQQNAKVLRIACVVYLLVLAIYTTVTAIAGESRSLITMYCVFDAVHLALCAVVFGGGSAEPGRSRRMEACRIAFEVSLLAFFVLEAVFPFPDQQSIYFPFPILLLVMIFTYRPGRMLALVLTYLGAFVVLVCLFKSPAVRPNDLYLASGTLVSALVGYAVVASLRFETSGAIGRLKYLSMTDPMTGLYNKQTFESLCAAHMKDAADSKGYALLFLDVDNFKQINDRFGHPVGDAVLVGLADVMRSSFYDKDYLCRFGGDEFIIFMADIRSETDVHERIKAFRKSVALMGAIHGVQGLSCSVGIAMKSGGPETYAELLSRADAALYIAKENSRINAAADSAAAHDAQPPAGETAYAEGGPARRKVLIVDDNMVNRMVLSQILSLDYEVLEAVDGQEALAILQRQYADISAVLLDIVMPVMDGYELLSLMREDERLANLPVIITTGHGEEEAEIKALSLGANDFVVKPYRPAIIMHRLQNTIRLRETSALLSAVEPGGGRRSPI